jgi:uncharacterized protein (TIGR02099 family)
MFATILKKVYQQLLLLVVVAVVLLAAYVSAGRQFMPAISRYASFLEDQIQQSTGIPVSVETLTGSFSGFNPVVQIDGLQLAVSEELPRSALRFASAKIIVDMPRSVWQRRWVLEEFVIESLAVDISQNTDGSWQLTGVNAAGGGDPVDLNSLYQTFLSFTRLDLTDVGINVLTRSGDRLSLVNGVATFQNQGDNHFLHVNANLEGNAEQLAFSFEVQGDALDEVSGTFHISVPNSDYSRLFAEQDLGQVAIESIQGGGQAWLNLENGEVLSANIELEVPGVTVSVLDGEPLRLDNLQGKAKLARGMTRDHWEVALADMSINYSEEYWRSFNAYVYLVPESVLNVRADRIELGLLAKLALDSGVLSDNAMTELQGFNPDGVLENFSLSMPLTDTTDDIISLRSNVVDGQIGSVRNSPNIWGIDAYVEMEFDQAAQQLTGLAEVDSTDFSMNIPATFTRVWDYSYVNGRLLIDVDLSNGQRVKLVSSRIVAESEAVDGNAQFTSITQRFPDGSRDASLDLVVGAERVDAAQKTLYLPDGPNINQSLRNTMQFLEQAIVDGDIYSSGILYRGSTVGGSPSETKTFQSYWQLENGQVNFSDEFPNLEELTATVVTDDNNIDVQVDSGRSLGMQMETATGIVRRNEAGRNLLTVTGAASGLTAQGLDYIQAAPLGGGLQETFSTWQAEGEFTADVEVIVPLDQDGAETEIRLDMLMADNDLAIPDFDLSVSQLSGAIIFDTRTGLEPTELSGEMFGAEIELALSSTGEAGDIETIVIEGGGSSTPAEMIAWPRQSEVVRGLLANMTGEFAYDAKMTIDQRPGASAANVLQIESDLLGVTMDLPEPFNKTPDLQKLLSLNLAFDGTQQEINGVLGEDLRFLLDIDDSIITDGLVVIGEQDTSMKQLANNDTAGLAILGSIERFDLEAWVNLITSMGNANESTSELGSIIAFVDIQSDIFSLYGEELPEVSFRMEPSSAAAGWLTRVSSDAVQGEVIIPYDNDYYLQVDLEYLRLPGDEEEEAESADVEAGETEAVEQTSAAIAAADQGRGRDEDEEREDPLIGLDPRELPLMLFETDEFDIGDRQFGSWAFTLTPTGVGAEFHDINFDFRGLRLGRDEPDEAFEYLEPHFSWFYDGIEHNSELTGVLVAGDISGVLEANGYAPSVESDRAVFVTELRWPGTPAFFSSEHLSGRIDMRVDDGRFLRDSGTGGALRLVSFINLTAVFQRLRFSDDLLRSGLAFDEITGNLDLDDGLLTIEDRLVISGPSSLYQITGEVDLGEESINGEMFVTLPVSNNLPWIGLLTANIPLAVGAYLFDRIFGDQVDSLSSAVYTLSGPIEGLEPEFKQAFGSPDTAPALPQ